MSEYTIRDIEFWDQKIKEIIKSYGLNCYDQIFEIISFEDMINLETYVGMPSHYPHWSFGKSYEKNKTLHKYNLTGLPYEMVINSDPCLAYLMRDNTLLLQILTVAHVYGHNDFFKNNRLFVEGTCAEDTLQNFKVRADRVRTYVETPGIGYENVERILDAAHALKYQAYRVIGRKRIDYNEQRQRMITEYQQRVAQAKRSPLTSREDIHKIPKPDIYITPPTPEYDILWFIKEYGRLESWEKDLIEIVIEEAKYFMPQIETKTMNEGWASFWHYTILNDLKLPQEQHVEFLIRHNAVIRPHEGGLNPYFIGFKIFQDIKEKYGIEKMFEVRELERDQSFLRKYLTQELCEELNLFEYQRKDKKYVVTEVSDNEGWKEIRDSLCASAGLGNNVPVIKIDEMTITDKTLMLEQEYDGRELDVVYATYTLQHLQRLWGRKVILKTKLNGKTKRIICDELNKIRIIDW